MKKAVVLLSGGMDSALTVALAIESGFLPAAFHLNYRQRTEKRELKAFDDLCNHWNIKEKLAIDTEFLEKIGNSSLTDKSMEVTNAVLDSDEIPSSYVPFRNGILISLASAWAETIGASAVFIGAMQLDSSGYPDCRPEYVEAFQQLANLATKAAVEGRCPVTIHAPLISMTKAEIIRTGLRLGVDYGLTTSCYAPVNDTVACGECDACLLRRRGFAENDVQDPVPYAH